MLNAEIGKRFEYCRVAKGLTPKEICREFDVNENMIRYWERGKKTMSVAVIGKAVSLFGLRSFDYLLANDFDSIPETLQGPIRDAKLIVDTIPPKRRGGSRKR